MKLAGPEQTRRRDVSTLTNGFYQQDAGRSHFLCFPRRRRSCHDAENGIE